MRGWMSTGGLVAVIVATSLALRLPAAGQQEARPAERAEGLKARVDALEARVKALEQRLDRAGEAAQEETRRPVALDESPITVRVVGKEFQEGNVLTKDVGDRIAIELEFTSALKKPARALTGVVVFRDALDQEVLRATLTCADDLRPHQSVRWYGTLSYHEFDRQHRRLRELAVKELEAEFIAERVGYSDGTREVFAGAEESKSVQDKLLAAGEKPVPPPKAAPQAAPAAQEGASPAGGPAQEAPPAENAPAQP